MIVALNVGNTNINFSLSRDGEVVSLGHAPTPKADISSEIERWIPDLLAEAPDDATPEFQFVMSSVVPAVAEAIREAVSRRGIPLLVADAATIPIDIRVDSPETVGDDRLLNAYAARRLHGAPAIVVDLGTATTFDVVSADGAFIGGAIAAGAGLGLDALARGTAQLPRVPLVVPEHAIGRDTVAAMQSGAVIGHSGLVLVLVRAITQELEAVGGPKPKVILTGGLSTSDWAQAIPGVDAIDPYLTLEGLVLLHQELATGAGVRS